MNSPTEGRRSHLSEFMERLERKLSSLEAQYMPRGSQVFSTGYRKVTKSKTDGLINLEVELPGFKKNDLTVTFEDYDSCGTRFEVASKHADKEFKIFFIFTEKVDADNAKAVMSAGILKVTVPELLLPDPKVTNVTVV